MEALELNSRLRAVQLRIEGACQRAGRAADSVRLLPVSKTISEDVIRLAYTAGCHCFGENRVQEAKRKSAALSDIAALEWSVIGHLQTNKVRDVVSFAREFQALDSLRVAEALEASQLHHRHQIAHVQAAAGGIEAVVEGNLVLPVQQFLDPLGRIVDEATPL